MTSYDAWKTTDRSREDDEEPRPDVGVYPGMRPMSEAPRDGYTHPIIGILHDTEEGEDPRVEVFYSPGLFGEEMWFDANGDGAPDSGGWLHWETDEFIGWLPVPHVSGGE